MIQDSNNYNIEDSIPISSVSEFIYCKRRWYLRNIEKLSLDNHLFVEGRIQHEKIHTPKITNDGEKIIVNNLQIYHPEYNLYGFCDQVDFIYKSDGVRVPFCDYPCIPIPIEYKHGKVRESKAYECQVIAQTICLEKMYNCKISQGYVYYVEDKQRKEVLINVNRKREVVETISLIRSYSNELINPEYSKKCRGCSMKEICQPKKYSVDKYMELLWEE